MHRSATRHLSIPLVLALVAASFVVLPGASAQSPEAPAVTSLSLSPTVSHCDDEPVVRRGDKVDFRGAATPGSVIDRVLLRDLDSAGNKIKDRDITSRPTVPTIDADGNISGTTPIGGFEFSSNAAAVRAIVVVEKDGLFSPDAISNPIRIDSVSPTFSGARTIGLSTVIADFSEPVEVPQEDIGPDWLVDGQGATTVSGDGASRTLSLSPRELDEDARPTVRYDPLPSHGGYVDCAGNDLSVNNGGLTRQAIDLTPPRIPVIATIDNQDASGDAVASSAQEPTITLNTITEDHTVVLYREVEPGTGLDLVIDDEVTRREHVPPGNTVTFEGDELNSIAAEGNHQLYAFAIDIHGNKSQHPTIANEIGYDSIRYSVDRTVPTVLAARTTGDQVVVEFSEDITGNSNQAGDKTDGWSITGCTCTIVRVTGSGDTRVLELAPSQIAPNGAQVSWTKPASGGYTDEAGNALAPFSALTMAGLIATVLDIVEENPTEAVANTVDLEIVVRDEFGQPVSGSLIGVRAVAGPSSQKDFDGPGGNPAGVIGSCISQRGGNCTVSYTSNTKAVDTIQAWISQGDVATGAPQAESQEADGSGDPATNDPIQDVVSVTWTVEGASIFVDAAQEEASGPIHQPHVVDVSVGAVESTIEERGPGVISGVNVDMLVTEGPNKDRHVDECTTGADGSCSLFYDSPVTGTDTLQVWIDRDDDDTPAQEAANAEEPDAESSLLPGDEELQDVVTKTWVGITVPTLQAAPEAWVTELGDERPLTFFVGAGSSSTPIEGHEVDAIVVSGPNAGRYLGDCLTNEQGGCSLAYESAARGTDIIQAWIDLDRDDIADEPSAFESVQESSGSDDVNQDVISGEWTIESATIDATPEFATLPVGQSSSLDATVRGKYGQLLGDVNVDAIVSSGANAGKSLGECTTNSQGRCALSYKGLAVGSDTIQLWIDLDDDDSPDEANAAEGLDETQGINDLRTDVVKVDWTLQGADLMLDSNNEEQTLRPNTARTINSRVTTATSGVKNVPVAARVVSGPSVSSDLDGDPATPAGYIGTCNTGADGRCSLSYTSQVEGADSILVWIDADSDRTSNEAPTAEAPGASGSADTPNQDVITTTWDVTAPDPSPEPTIDPDPEPTVDPDPGARSISIGASQKRVRLGKSIVLTGAISGQPTCLIDTVDVTALRGSRERWVGSADTTADGSWSLRVKPRWTSIYRATVPGTDLCRKAESSSPSVTVKAKVIARTADEVVPESSCGSIFGRVDPSKKGQLVKLQQRRNSKWRAIDTEKLAGDSTYSFDLCPSTPGTRTYRVRWGGDQLNAAASSHRIRLTFQQ